LSNVIYIADCFLEDYIGGGELNDEEVLLLLKEKNISVKKIRSLEVTKKFILDNVSCFFIISNFIGLSQEIKNTIQTKVKYIIYEHDHKYLRSRNPALFNDYKAPSSELVNIDFYKNAKKIFCQSIFHKQIIVKNTNLSNVVNVSGNLWNLKTLDMISTMSELKKEKKVSILDSPISHKNTVDAEFYCKSKKIKYDKIKSKDYKEFLSLLSKNEKFLFIPKTPETLSRIVVEAKMLNVKVITNKNVGATYEDWYHLNGKELINKMKSCRENVANLILKEMEK